MSTDDEIHNALLAINSRLNTIDGKVTLVARAERKRILADLESVIRRRPIIGRIYLLLNGSRNQRQISEELSRQGHPTTDATISRAMGRVLAREHGIAEFVKTGPAGAKIYRKNREVESVLNLTPKVERWLADIDNELP